MEKEPGNNKIIHIGFAGRLEREKGIVSILELIEKVKEYNELKERVVFHIVGEGSYREKLKEKISEGYPKIFLYGNISHKNVLKEMSSWDIVFMPSIFLETFGLVALEAVTLGIPVSGIRKGGLSSFVSEELALSETNPVKDMIRILEEIADGKKYSLPNITDSSKEVWDKNLGKILKDTKNILIVHDYRYPIGGAEVYIDFLEKEIEKPGYRVSRYGKDGKLGKFGRIFYATIAPIAFWRYFSMRKYIEKAKPDFIWMHTILRYIGPWGIKAIHDSGIPHALMHHDLGLIVARPSRLEHESELPENLSLKNFLQGSSSLREYCMRCIKYSSLVLIWKYLSKAEFHIVPANFMYDSISKISGKDAILFPHTIIDTLPFENTSKKEK